MTSPAPLRLVGVRTVALLLAVLAASATGAGCRATNEAPASAERAAAREPTAAAPAAPSGAQTAPDDGAPARRIVAIGDMHGDLAAAKRALEIGGVLGPDGRWAGGTTLLVQTGDVLDRGNDEPEIMDLLEALRREAEEVGGEVVLLNGNHELMNAMGDLRYVTAEGFTDYAHVPSDHLPPLEEVPAPARGRLAAFLPGGPVARRLATRDVIAVIDGNVFVHGGVLPEHIEKWGVARINEDVRAWLAGKGPMPQLVTGEDSPVWSRHYSDEPGERECALLEQTLTLLGAERMIVGHTPQRTGITSACNERVWRVDTGMAAHYGGPTQVLEIVGSSVRVLQ